MRSDPVIMDIYDVSLSRFQAKLRLTDERLQRMIDNGDVPIRQLSNSARYTSRYCLWYFEKYGVSRT